MSHARSVLDQRMWQLSLSQNQCAPPTFRRDRGPLPDPGAVPGRNAPRQCAKPTPPRDQDSRADACAPPDEQPPPAALHQPAIGRPALEKHALNKHRLDSDPSGPCESRKEYTHTDSCEDFVSANERDYSRIIATVNKAPAKAFPGVMIEYEIVEDILHALITVHGVFRYQRTPLPLERESANWLMTVPALLPSHEHVTVTMQRRGGAEPSARIATYQLTDTAQYEQFQVDDFVFALVLQPRATDHSAYTTGFATALTASSVLVGMLGRIATVLNKHNEPNAKNLLEVHDMLQVLDRCDSSVDEAYDTTILMHDSLVCTKSSAMIAAMTVVENSTHSDWTITAEDVLMSINLRRNHLLDVPGSAPVWNENTKGLWSENMIRLYQAVTVIQDTYVTLSSVLKHVDGLEQVQGPKTFEGHADRVRSLISQRQAVMSRLVTQAQHEQTSKYNKVVKRVLYLVLNCIDHCLVTNIDELCGTQSVLHRVCLHRRQLHALRDGFLKNEKECFELGDKLMQESMHQLPPVFFHSTHMEAFGLQTDVVRRIWKNKVLESVQEELLQFWQELLRRSVPSRGGERTEIHMIAQQHNMYYSRVRRPRIVLDRLVLQVCQESKWSRIFRLVVFGDLQMQVIRDKETYEYLMHIHEHTSDYEHNPLVRSYLETHDFIRYLTGFMAGRDISENELHALWVSYKVV